MTPLELDLKSADRRDVRPLIDHERPPNFEDHAVPLYESIYRFARSLVKSEADAEDLVQETYLKAYRGFSTFEPGSNFRAWIFRILKNTFLSSMTSAYQRHIVLFATDEPIFELRSSMPDPLSIVLDQARRDEIQTAIDQLPTITREILELRYIEGVSYVEAARMLSIPTGTVMSRLARARESVRKAVQISQRSVTRSQ